MVTIDTFVRWAVVLIIGIPLAILAVFVGSVIVGVIGFLIGILYTAATALF